MSPKVFFIRFSETFSTVKVIVVIVMKKIVSYVVLQNVVNCSACIASNGNHISELWIRKVVEEGSRSLIYDVIPVFARKYYFKNTEVVGCLVSGWKFYPRTSRIQSKGAFYSTTTTTV